MGKPKFDKNKGVTFKLVYRDEEQIGPEKTLSERIFSVIEDQKVLATKENDTYRQKILSQFTKEELGQAPKKKVTEDSSQHNNNISSHTKGREDLWITHLMRMKEQARRQAKEEEESEEEEEIVTTKKDNKASLIEKLKQQGFKKLGQQQAAKIAAQKKKTEEKGKDDEEDEWEDDDGEDGEWEDEEEEADYDVEEEWEEEEEEEDPEAEEYEEFNDEEVDAELAKMGQGEKVEKTEKKKGGAMEEVTITKAPIVKVDDFPTLGGMGADFVEEGELPLVILPAEAKVIEEKVIEEAAEEPMHLDKIEVQGDIRMKRYDDLGLPMDGYNYYQHIAPSNAGGAPTFQFEVTYDHVVQLPADKDAERNKLNAEEKELYDALDEEDAGAYDDLEDDFFEAIIKGSNVKLGEKQTTVSKPVEKVVKEKKPKEKEEVKKSMLPKKIVKAVVEDKEEIIEILPSKDEILAHMQVRKEEKEEKRVQDKVYKKMEFQKVLTQHLEMLKDKYKDEREKNKAKYQIESSEEEEVEDDDDVEEVDSFASLNEDNKEWVEKLPYAQDEWAQKGAIVSSSEDERDYEEEVGRSEPRNTKAPSEFSFVSMPVAKKANLNIIKEDRRTKRADKEKETTEKAEKKEDEEDSETDDDEDDDEEEDGKGKVEEVFKKREKGETKEEKKARKEAIKQFKKERKEKKKNFKEAFEHKRKEQVKIAAKHTQAMQGLAIHKLTI